MEEGDKNMVQAVCTQAGIVPFELFLLAYEYAEDYSHEYDMENFFRSCCFEARAELHLHKIPFVVQSFCIDVLSGRIKLKKKGKGK